VIRRKKKKDEETLLGEESNFSIAAYNSIYSIQKGASL
jgi:hypothetical protein